MRTDSQTERQAGGGTEGRRDETQSHFSQFCEPAQKLEFLEHTRIGQPADLTHNALTQFVYLQPIRF